LGLSAVAGIGIGALLYGLADYLAENLFQNPSVTPILHWIGISIPLVTTARVLLAALRGFGYVRYEIFIDSVASNVSRLSLTVIFLMLGMGLNGVLAAFALSWLIEVGLLIFFLNRRFSLKRPIRSSRRDLREILSFSIPVCLDQVLRQVGGNTELLLLGWLSSLAAVGIYSAASRVQMVGAMFLQAAEMVAKPIISDLHHRGELLELHQIYQTLTRWSLAFILPYLLTVILFAEPLLSIFGEEFKAGALVLIIVSIGTLVNAGTGICGALLVMTGHSRLTFLNSLSVMILHVLLNVILIPVWGVLGAAVATSLSVTTINLVRLFQVYRLHKLWPYSSEFIKPLIAIVAALVAILGINYLTPAEQSLFHILFSMVLLWSTYLVVTLLLGLTSEDRLILSIMKRRIGRVFGLATK
jgi:O-antigen/teichoic acid export membrane protein